jgi:ABC-type oligopeptide transport system ATPase subunit
VSALLEVEGLVKHFPVRTAWTDRLLGRTAAAVRAVEGVSFAIAPGETLGLVGESGSGKTTVGRSIVRLETPTAGRISLMGRRIDGLDRAAMREMRRSVQFVLQDPFASLNPRMTRGRGRRRAAAQLRPARRRGAP